MKENGKEKLPLYQICKATAECIVILLVIYHMFMAKKGRCTTWGCKHTHHHTQRHYHVIPLTTFDLKKHHNFILLVFLQWILLHCFLLTPSMNTQLKLCKVLIDASYCLHSLQETFCMLPSPVCTNHRFWGSNSRILFYLIVLSPRMWDRFSLTLFQGIFHGLYIVIFEFDISFHLSFEMCRSLLGLLIIIWKFHIRVHKGQVNHIVPFI